MNSLLDKHRNTLLAIATVLGVAALIWLDAQRGHLPDGADAPELTLQVLGEDKPMSLSDLRGQPAVLDFWATWCGPCRKSLPHMDELATKHTGKARFFAVNSQDEAQVLQEGFRKETGLKLPMIVTGARAALAFKVEVLPTTVVLDRDGHVARTFTGAVNTDAIDHLLEQLE